MLGSLALASLLAVSAPATREGGTPGGSVSSRILLRGYDRFTVVDVAEPTQVVNEWNLAGSVRDIVAAAISKSTLLVLGRSPGEELPCLLALSLLDSAIERVECAGILAISVDSLSETGFLLERHAGDPNAVQVVAVDLSARPLRRGPQHPVELAAISFSVANRGERIVLESGGFLFDLDRPSGNLSRLAQGSGPSLSPDGSRLAFLQDGDLYVYDYEKHIVRRILNRQFWQPSLIGPVSWSPGGEFLSISAPTGIAGKRLRCLVVSETGKVSTSFESGTSWCGPWIWTRP